jgi:murein L,D-transpeptidase YafK
MPRFAAIVFLLTLLPQAASADYAPSESEWRADRILVDKSERKLYLLRGDRILRIHGISLGGRPVGHKLEEGDQRTPEGDYFIDWRNPDSDFYMSMHISYPNTRDIESARAGGRDPGGMIMIHGLPNDSAPTRTDYLDEDWTDGCIAVSNQAMIDIWLSVDDNTPITIRP